LALVAAFGLIAVPAGAQQVGAPVPLVPSAAPPAPAPAAQAPAPNPSPEDIEAQPLAPTDSSWAGTLGPDQNALPIAMWQGTPRSYVAASLPLIAPSNSPAIQTLSRLLLLSDAAAPAGADPSDRPSLATIRLDRLLALGFVKPALAIADRIPADPSSDTQDRDKVELHFAAHDTTGACQAVSNLIARYQNIVWWARALVACQALAGDGAKASLGLAVLHEQKVPPDPAFDLLIDALQGHPHRIEKPGEPTPLRLTLLAAAHQPLSPETLAAASPSALLAYVANDDLPALQRLPAAERAALLGALAPDALATLYQAIEIKPTEEQAALKDDKPPDAHQRAILYSVARSGEPAETREAAIAALFADGRKRGAFPLTARLVAPALTELDPASANAAFAADAARALLVAGQADAAQRWIDAANTPELRALAWLAGSAASGNADTAALLKDAIAALASRDSGAAPAQADLLVALAASFNAQIGTLDWAPLIAPPHSALMPSAAFVVDQEQAAAAKRPGETVLSSILIVESAGALTSEPLLLWQAIAGLRAVGREADARALAVEAAIDAGV
jgi:hypothetical protein